MSQVVTSRAGEDRALDEAVGLALGPDSVVPVKKVRLDVGWTLWPAAGEDAEEPALEWSCIMYNILGALSQIAPYIAAP